MKAYVLIKIKTGQITRVVQHLKRTAGVIQTDMTFGPYDAISILEADDVNAIGDMIARRIQAIPGVTETLTCLRVEEG